MTTGDGKGAPGCQSREPSEGRERSTGKALTRRRDTIQVAAVFEPDDVTGMRRRMPASVPHPRQNGRKTTVTSGHPGAIWMASDLDTRRLTSCLKRSSKQSIIRLGMSVVCSNDQVEAPALVDLGPRLAPVAIRHARLELTWRVLRVVEDWTTPRYHDAVGTRPRPSGSGCACPGHCPAVLRKRVSSS